MTLEPPVERGLPLRVLLLEDLQDDAYLCLRTLQSGGFDASADVVETLAEFEARLYAGSYDVILSDYTLPDATAMDALEIQQRLGPQVPFILVTGFLGDEKAVECLKQGVSDYVLKDRLARLPEAVRRALGERHLREERARAEVALRQSEQQLRQRNRELEEQNRRVEAASRLKSEFLANMSHELRSPLNGIIGFTELMFDGKLGDLSEAQKDCIRRILNSSHHLLRLINDLLDLARIEAGKLTLHPEPVVVARVVAKACDSLAALAAEKRIRVECQTGCEIEAVIDPARLQQIVYNYLSNALKFTSEGGLVRVAVQEDGDDRFRVEVNDTGLGIAEADMAGLFTEFHQLDSGKSKRFPGTGLGLALTRRVVEAQGGTVGVRSTLGKGSTFFAVLPRGIRKGREDETPADSGCR